MADAKMLNLQRINAKLGRLPSALKDQVAAQLKVEVDGLVEAQKRAAPVKTGQLRDSIHAYENPDRDLSWRVVAGGKPTTVKIRHGVKDADFAKGVEEGGNQGEFDYARAEEFGHRTVDGTPVPAKPFFFPTYRARKKGMRSRLTSTGRKAAKQLFPG